MNTLKPDNMFAEHYQLIKLVDTGGFAEVWEALFSGESVALKIFPKLNEEGIEKVRTEYGQSKLLHTHLIVPSHFGVYDNQAYLVMKFCEGGNASSRIQQCSEADLAKCLFHVAGALAYLHHKDYVHQDIKPNNILLDEEGDYYLTDLGLSIKLRQVVRRFTQGMQGSIPAGNYKNATIGITPPCYRAPELDKNSSASKPPIKATDVWALGATIFELASGEVPFGDAGGMLQLLTPEPPNMPAIFSPELNSIVKRCLAKDPWKRPMANELEEWGGYYLKHGYWPQDAESPGEGEAHMPGVNTLLAQPVDTLASAAIKASIKPPTPVGKKSPTTLDTVETVENKHRPGKLILALLFLMVAAGAAWGVYKFARQEKSQSNNSGSRHEEKVVPQPEAPKPAPAITKTDTDNDGVVDSVDRCPETRKGVRVDDKGCPQKNDGKVNPPVITGKKINKTKDSDGDGVPDAEDKCKDQEGPRLNHGCPTN